MLDIEYTFYKKNKADFLTKHKNKFLVIVGENLLGVYESEKEAYEASIKEHELGTFLIQHCIEDEQETIQTFHSRIVFA